MFLHWILDLSLFVVDDLFRVELHRFRWVVTVTISRTTLLYLEIVILSLQVLGYFLHTVDPKHILLSGFPSFSHQLFICCFSLTIYPSFKYLGHLFLILYNLFTPIPTDIFFIYIEPWLHVVLSIWDLCIVVSWRRLCSKVRYLLLLELFEIFDLGLFITFEIYQQKRLFVLFVWGFI